MGRKKASERSKKGGKERRRSRRKSRNSSSRHSSSLEAESLSASDKGDQLGERRDATWGDMKLHDVRTPPRGTELCNPYLMEQTTCWISSSPLPQRVSGLRKTRGAPPLLGLSV